MSDARGPSDIYMEQKPAAREHMPIRKVEWDRLCELVGALGQKGASSQNPSLWHSIAVALVPFGLGMILTGVGYHSIEGSYPAWLVPGLVVGGACVTLMGVGCFAAGFAVGRGQESNAQYVHTLMKNIEDEYESSLPAQPRPTTWSANQMASALRTRITEGESMHRELDAGDALTYDTWQRLEEWHLAIKEDMSHAPEPWRQAVIALSAVETPTPSSMDAYLQEQLGKLRGLKSQAERE